MKHKLLHDLCACTEAVDFCENFPDLESAWLACPHGDWLLWFASKCTVDRKLLVRIACDCARQVPVDPCMSAYLVTAERWARGEATFDEVKNRRIEISHKGGQGCNSAAFHAASTVFYGGYASSTAYVADQLTGKKQSADIVRKYLPTLPSVAKEEVDE